MTIFFLVIFAWGQNVWLQAMYTDMASCEAQNKTEIAEQLVSIFPEGKISLKDIEVRCLSFEEYANLEWK